MNIITCTLTGDTEAMYHKIVFKSKMTEFDSEGGSATLSLWCPKEIKAGDAIDWYHTEPVAIVEAVLERRDHKGVFTKPEMSVKSFYLLKVSFISRAKLNAIREKLQVHA